MASSIVSAEAYLANTYNTPTFRTIVMRRTIGRVESCALRVGESQ
jgi:hypothetical protein